MKTTFFAILMLAFAAQPLFAETGATAPAGADPSMAKADCKSESHYPEIDKATLTSLVGQKGVMIVDVNSKDSFQQAHVPGAIHFGSMKPAAFVKALPEDHNAPIVAYCGGPECGAWKKAAENACEHGYTNIKHFKGGIKGWVAKN